MKKYFSRIGRAEVLTYSRLFVAVVLILAFSFACGVAWTLNYVRNVPMVSTTCRR